MSLNKNQQLYYCSKYGINLKSIQKRSNNFKVLKDGKSIGQIYVSQSGACQTQRLKISVWKNEPYQKNSPTSIQYKRTVNKPHRSIDQALVYLINKRNVIERFANAEPETNIYPTVRKVICL